MARWHGGVGVAMLASALASSTARAEPPAEGDDALSTSGTSLSRPPPPPPAARPTDSDARIQALEKRVVELEKEQKNDEKRTRSWIDMIKLAAFAQPQLLVTVYDVGSTPNRGPDGSRVPFVDPNTPVPTTDGDTTNSTYFRMRRARPRLDFAPFDFARLVVELELGGRMPGVPGSQIVARQIEVQGLLRYTRDVSTTFAAGIMRVPFGNETLEAETTRPFIERSFMQQSILPGEFDTGVRADTRAWDDKAELQFAVINGLMLGEQAFSGLPDLNRGKDVAWRLHGDLDAVGLGASGYVGTGQLVDTAAWQSKDYLRWAVGFEGQLHGALLPALGETRVLAEGVVSRNMDRGLFYRFALPGMPADITKDVVDRDEVGFVARFEQDASRWITTGLRFDGYSPDTKVEGNWRFGYSFVGVVHFTKNLQLMLEYGVARDAIHAPGTALSPRWIITSSTVFQAAF